MSDEASRIQRSKRFYRDKNKIKKRSKTLKEKSQYNDWNPAYEQPHRLHKVSGMNCGNSNCVMCGNPRKMFDLKTIQEQKFSQDELWSED